MATPEDYGLNCNTTIHNGEERVMKIKKSDLTYWIVVFCLQALFIGWYQGAFANMKLDFNFSNPVVSTKSITVTPQQATLVKNAFTLVKGDIENGRIQSTELALSALYAELPLAIRDSIIRAVGTPELSKFASVLDKTEAKLKIK
jgi:hypothetical protein